MGRSNTKRLFFALWPDDQVRAQLHQLQKSLDLSGGRQVHESDMHVTLQYLGQVGIDQLECVIAAASRVKATPFTLEIGGVRYWRRPKILWAGFTTAPDELQYLVEQLGKQLTLCGFKPEDRKYRPHVTLARKVKMAFGFQRADTISWRTDEFILVESHTDGRMPRYEAVARFPLN